MSTATTMRTLLICLCLLAATNPASAVDVHTPAEVIVENGTTVILKCSFKSNEEVGSATTVMWSFRPTGSDSVPNPIFVFYYGNGKGIPSKEQQFKERVQFIGDVNKKDASIQLLQVQPNDEGAYSCDVKNPPDVVSQRRLSSRTELMVTLGGLLSNVTSNSCQEADRGNQTSKCPNPKVPDNGGLACVTVNKYRYCKPMCNKGFDFNFLRRSRLYERCGVDTRFSWQSQYIGGNRLADCIVSSIQVSGGATAYFQQDCRTTQSSNHSTIQTFIAELREQDVDGATSYACLACG